MSLSDRGVVKIEDKAFKGPASGGDPALAGKGVIIVSSKIGGLACRAELSS